MYLNLTFKETIFWSKINETNTLLEIYFKEIDEFKLKYIQVFTNFFSFFSQNYNHYQYILENKYLHLKNCT